MQYHAVPTKPAFQVDGEKAFAIGAWAGVCFALAVLSAAAVLVNSGPNTSKPMEQASTEQAWAPTISLPSRN